MNVQEHVPARSECDVISHQSPSLNMLRYINAALMHDENEYQGQPVRNGAIISLLYVGTIEHMGSFVQF